MSATQPEPAAVVVNMVVSLGCSFAVLSSGAEQLVT
jgi:hypothetical protein